MKVVGMIPVRMESSRLPGKPLLEIENIPMVIHVLKRCALAKSLDELYVVTDSEEIKDVVSRYGGRTILTSKNHQTGTDRIAEAALSVECDIIVNIQGDEALVKPEDIDKVVENFKKTSSSAAILVVPFEKKNSPSDIKVVLNKKNEVMYLSREDIPSDSRTTHRKMLKAYHIVPFKKEFLIEYAKMEKTELEQVEYNEYLRILENGYKIQAVHCENSTISVDTAQDLDFVRSVMNSDETFRKYKES